MLSVFKDKEEYRRLLGLFYGFYKPVEDSLGTGFATESLVRDLGTAPHIVAMIERQVGTPLPFYFFRRAAAGERWNGFDHFNYWIDHYDNT